MCESAKTERIIIPPDKAFEILKKAEKVFVRNCPCRVQARLCPPDTREVCLLFENASQEDLQKARSIDKNEALAILKTTLKRNVIYTLFYSADHQKATEICSCCTCCCRSIRDKEGKGNYHKLLQSEYVAVTDEDLCTGCGTCEESCFFKARQVISGIMQLNAEQCYGCGRCIPFCPEGAIKLERQTGRGMPIPTTV
jgi:ferredoxin